jgi:rubrerythrin
MKPTKKWLKEQIKDEKMASKMYIKHGFPRIAKDERKHMRILKKRLKKVGL